MLSFVQTRLHPPDNPALAGEVAVLHGLAEELPAGPTDGADPAAVRTTAAPSLTRQLSDRVRRRRDRPLDLGRAA